MYVVICGVFFEDVMFEQVTLYSSIRTCLFFSRNSLYMYIIGLLKRSSNKQNQMNPQVETNCVSWCFVPKSIISPGLFSTFLFFSPWIVVVSEDKHFAMSVETLRTLQQRLAERQPKLNPHLGILDQETKSLQKRRQVVVEQIFPCLPWKVAGKQSHLIHFVFRMGWNHQLGSLFLFLFLLLFLFLFLFLLLLLLLLLFLLFLLFLLLLLLLLLLFEKALIVFYLLYNDKKEYDSSNIYTHNGSNIYVYMFMI